MNDDTALPEDLEPTEMLEPGSHGRQIGPYRLLEKIGEGGMGEVWLAEQLAPVKRKVALKVIKQGMDTRQVVARFEAERQALALMDHPCIAKVYDAGATPRGRPYFVMEHVKGIPITEHCDRNKLTNRERLDLFMQVCEGVQHAHHKAVIHRDLKPGNVLVSMQDGKPVPKIIDFGVAKATAQRLTDKTLHTQLGVLIGTPEYMSPEQAEMTGQDIDTRTDVYALGVMLYQLLVGALPFDPKELRQAGFEAIVRRIREDEPPKPSTRLTTLGEHSTESAKLRRTELPALKRELAGDLDWITMKALEKDRSRRYASPLELAADIERYRTDQPVLARPPSAAYRAKKFVRRHTVGVAAATVGLLVLVAFAATMAVQAKRIAVERDRANQEAEAKGQVSEFMKDLFTVSDPGEARGNSITARELLDRGAEKIDGMLAAQPDVRADLMDTMGDVYTKLGLYPQAEPLLKQALETRQGLFGDEHPETLKSMNNLAILYKDQGRYDEAEPLFLETLENRKSVLGDEHPDTLRSMNNLASLQETRGRYDEAEALHLETLEIRKRVHGDEHPDTLGSEHNLALLYMQQGRYDEAEPLFLKTVETKKRVLGNDHPGTLASVISLANLYWKQGRYDEVEPLYVEALEIAKHVLGDDHPDTLGITNNLAHLHQGQGRYDEAETLYLGILETQKRVLGNDHPITLTSMSNLGALYSMQGRYDEAEGLLRETTATRKRVLGDDHPDSLGSIGTLAALYQNQGRYDEAEPLFVENLETQKRVLGDDHPGTLGSSANLAFLYSLQGRYDEAEPLYRQTLEAQERVLGDDHPATLGSMNLLASLYAMQGRYDEAEPLHLETLETRKRLLGDQHPQTVESLYNLACFEALRRNRAKALDWLGQAVDAGFPAADWMARDPDLESLHGPELDELVERVRRRATEDQR